MILHVFLEISRSGKCFGAELAGMRLDLLVGHLVVVEVGRGGEALAAGLAPVRLLSCVDPPVGVEAGAGAEPLAAEVTSVRPLSRVNPHVSLQQTRSVELLTAGLARQQSLRGKFSFDSRLLLLHDIHLQELVLRLPRAVGDVQTELAPGRVAPRGG